MIQDEIPSVESLRSERAHQRFPRMAEIIRDVAQKHGVTVAQLHGNQRVREVVFARYEACWRCWTEAGATYSSIARALGNRDHSGVMHAVKQYKKYLAAKDVSPTISPGEKAE